MTASIDVLIPAYNAVRTIRSAVDSIRAQTVRDIAIHVVNDGSTDATGSILDALAAEDPRLHVHHKSNGGIVDALNHGLSFCTAPLIARHDADDIAYPHRFAVQKAWLDSHPDAVAVGSAARYIDVDDHPIGMTTQLHQPDEADLFAVPAREPYIIHPFLMVRRDAIARVGGYRHAHHAEDADLYWRLLREGRLHNLPDILGDYRMHDESVSGRSIVNGRIMAIGSQLAAFSARRRASGQADLTFAKAQQRELEAATTIAPMVEIAGAGLSASERAAFAESVAGKLLELTGYRPYELERSDVAFARRIADRGFGHLPPQERALQVRRLAGSGARLAASGRVSDGFALVPPMFLPQMLVRWVIRMPLFRGIRTRIVRAQGAPVK